MGIIANFEPGSNNFSNQNQVVEVTLDLGDSIEDYDQDGFKSCIFEGTLGYRECLDVQGPQLHPPSSFPLPIVTRPSNASHSGGFFPDIDKRMVGKGFIEPHRNNLPRKRVVTPQTPFSPTLLPSSEAGPRSPTEESRYVARPPPPMTPTESHLQPTSVTLPRRPRAEERRQRQQTTLDAVQSQKRTDTWTELDGQTIRHTRTDVDTDPVANSEGQIMRRIHHVL
ncbi:hypothetical protein BYT27DRAFT_7209200 [Phlegmacium glaucopus]|nr:hypothetical protein BYT27DRAFT_7209200 [Phlegmacium glaucopus]